MAVNTKEVRGRLEDAYAASAGLPAGPTSLRAYLRSQEQLYRAATGGGSIESSSSDGKMVKFAAYGPGQITPLELVELYRWCVDQFDQAFLWLTNCAAAGVDAFVTDFTDYPTAPLNPVENPVIIDATGRWAQLCLQYGIAKNLIVGAAVSDKAIFLWLMFHEVPAVEAFSDYGQMRIAQGNQFT